MRRTHLWQVVFVCAVFIAMGAASGRMPSIFADDNARGWPQWGQNPQHSGSIGIAGQSPSEQLAKMTYDPFVAQEQAENNGELLAHYQAPLTDGQDVFMEFISGTYNSCNPTGSYTPFPCGNDNWFNQVWNEKRLHWQNGQLVQMWSFASDWKPEPDAGGSLGGWQPVFHAALTSDSVWVPGAGGTVFRLAIGSGTVLARFNPFGNTIDPNTFVSSPITVDAQGNVYYNVLRLNITNNPATNDPWAFGPNFDGNGAADIRAERPWEIRAERPWVIRPEFRWQRRCGYSRRLVSEDFEHGSYRQSQLQEPDVQPGGPYDVLRHVPSQRPALASQPDGHAANHPLPFSAPRCEYHSRD